MTTRPRFRFALVRFAVGALASLSTQAAMAGGACAESGLISDRAYVRIDPAVVDLPGFFALFHEAFPSVPLTALDSIPGRNIHLFAMDYSAIPPAQLPSVLGQIDAYFGTFEDGAQSETGVLYVDPLYACEAPEGGTGSLWLSIEPPTSLSDQYFWTITNILQAQSLSQGQGVTVAVIDTGVDASHPVLAGSVLPALGFNFVTGNAETGDLSAQADSDGDGLVDEMTGHGTFVAGIIATVAPQAKIVPITTLDSNGNGDLYTLAKSLFHAIDLGVDVINLSVSSTYKSQAVEDATDEARAKGIVLVAATGNCGTDEPEQWPAFDNDVFSVLATDHADVKADFSNFGQNLFICAPGNTESVGGVPVEGESIVGILPDGAYGAWEGTSFATPIVAGAVALVRAQMPTMSRNAGLVEAIRARFVTTAADICPQNPAFCPSNDSNDPLLGAGRINIGGAVALGPPAPALGDLDANGAVGASDLAVLLAAWGPCPPPPTPCPADLDGDNAVGATDLAELLARWSR